MAVNPSPFGPKPQFELASGQPAVGNKLFFYVGGSVNTKQNTYTDSTGATANSNPIVLDALGMPPNEIWFTEGVLYKVVYAPSTDTDPPTSPIWTIDNLAGQNDTTSTVDQWEASGLIPTFTGATSFTVPGDQTAELHIGRRLRFTVALGTVYGTIVLSSFGAVTTVTMLMDGSQALDAGLSSVDWSILRATVSAVPWVTMTDNGAAIGPQLILQRVSASPAASDALGSVQFWGRDTAAADTIYGQVYGKIVDPSNTSEDGQVAISTLVAGAQAERLIVGGGIYTPAATGGDQGAGTLNLSSGLYVQGVRAPDVPATQIEMETATSFQVAATPGNMIFHPNAIKVWGVLGLSGGAAVAGNGITTTTDTGAGQVTITFANNFTNANYCVLTGAMLAVAPPTGTNYSVYVAAGTNAVGSVQLACVNSSTAALVDPTTYYYFAILGDL